MPHLPLDLLLERDAGRAEEARVPPDVLAKMVHRRSLLSAGLLLEEGFEV